MNFSDLHFWLLLAPLLVATLVLRLPIARFLPGHLRLFDHAALACINLTLFFNADARSCAILLSELLLTFWLIRVALAGEKATRTLCLATLVLLHLAVLGYFKYSRFFIHDLFGLTWQYAPLTIPAGISFYTFQKLAFAIDTVRNRRDLPQGFNFLNYNTFFPQLVAGPIERRVHLLPQIERFSLAVRLQNFQRAVPLLALGLFYKLVLADNLAIFEQRNSLNAYMIWLTCLLFGLRIYFDFAGYSFIAMGLAQLFGVQLSLNFRAPYSSADIREFWQRWHITLSTWFRDYLYIPMGGSKRGSHSLNLFVVFLVSGFWHGAGLNFILWGAWHGLLMIVSGNFGKLTWKLPGLVTRTLTLVSVFFSWLFFYETNLPALVAKLEILVRPGSYAFANFMAVIQQSYSLGDRGPLLFSVLSALAILAIEFRHRHRANPCEPMLDWRAACVFAVFIALFTASENSSFLYFAF